MNYRIPNVKTFEYSRIIGIEKIKFGKNIIVDDFAFIYATAEIIFGDFVHIACFASISGGAKIEIGDFVAVSHGARILSGTDDFKDWGFGNSTIDEKYRNVYRAPVYVERFCIIGANSVILPDVRVGEGATIGANSVVSRDLKPWGVYIGNKRIAERNQKEVLKTYEKFRKELTLSKDA